MQPSIEHHEPRIIAGFSYCGNPTHSHPGWTHENEIGRLWQRFLAFCRQDTVKDTAIARAPINYEIHLQGEDAAETGELDVFVGAEVPDAASVPVRLCVKVLPEADYALFTLRGKAILGGADCPIDEWLRTSGYRSALPLSVQRYDDRFKGMDRIEESELDFLIPVVRAE